MGDVSQWGEYKLLTQIFKVIGTTNRYCIEVGAWDGKHFSNTWNLRQEGWTGVLAEADLERAKQIMPEPGVQVFGRVENIDLMLDHVGAPLEPDLLSIDVDGDDYYLWADMAKYRPRVVVIEYNQTVPADVDIRQERGGTFGASFEAIDLLAARKGYCVAAVTTTNIIYAQTDAWERWAAIHGRTRPEPQGTLQHIITGYNGKQYVLGQPAHNDNQGGAHETLISDTPYKPI